MENVLRSPSMSTNTPRCVKGLAAANYGGLLLPFNNYLSEVPLFDFFTLLYRRLFPCRSENLYPPRGEYKSPSQYQTGEMFCLVRLKPCPQESILGGVRVVARQGMKTSNAEIVICSLSRSFTCRILCRYSFQSEFKLRIGRVVDCECF